MSDTQLKPCPFCGTKPHPITADLLTRPCFYYECENKTCHAAEKGWHDTEQEAIDAWNTRPIEEALQARIAELEAQNKWHKYPENKPPDGTIAFIVCYQIHYGVKVPMYGLATHYADGWREVDNAQHVVSNVYAWHEIPAIPAPELYRHDFPEEEK